MYCYNLSCVGVPTSLDRPPGPFPWGLPGAKKYGIIGV